MGSWHGRLRSQPVGARNQYDSPNVSIGVLRGFTYGDFEIDHLLRKSAHLVVEAETVFSHIVCREYKVALSLLGSIQDGLVCWADNQIVDIE